MAPRGIDTAALMEHRDFVARIARRLLSAEDAEDVVQETWLATLRRPPPEDAPLRAWLARVARNLSIQTLRRRRRRERLEPRGARLERAPATSELVDRLAWQQRVAEAVLELDEPYREAILLRFFENLPPRAVARRVGAPINTVRTRLRRGLALLRGRLDREAGGRAALGAVLLALAAAPARGAGAAHAAGLVLAVAGLVFVLVQAGRGTPQEAARATTDGGRAPAAAGATAAHGRGGASVAGRLHALLTAECAASGGVRAVVRADGGVVTEARLAPGAFALPYPRTGSGFVLELSGPGVAARTLPLPEEATDLGDVHLAPATSFGGKVFGPDGEPLDGAEVIFGTTLRRGPLRFAVDARSAPTSADGSFRLEIPEGVVPSPGGDGLLKNHLLYVRHGTGWAGPYYPHVSGLEQRMLVRVDFAEDPVLRIVREGVPERATVDLYTAPSGDVTVPGPPLDRATLDAGGRATPRWDPWHEQVLLDIRTERGERFQSLLYRGDAETLGTWEVDVGETAWIRLPVVAEDGETPAAGATVHLGGTWVPHGYPPLQVALLGTVPPDGVVEWRFPAMEPELGEFRAGFCTVEDRRAALPRLTRVHEPGEALLSGAVMQPVRLDASPDSFLAVIESDEAPRWTDPSVTGPVPLGGGGFAWRVHCGALDGDADALECSFAFAGARETTVRLERDRLRRLTEGHEVLRVGAPPPRPAAVVRVAREDGSSVPGAPVSVAGRSGVLHVRADTEGRAIFLVPPGSVSVAARDPATGRLACLRDWGGRREATLVPEEPRWIRFRVAFEDGTPAQDVAVQMASRHGIWAPSPGRMAPDADGFFAAHVVPAFFDVRVLAGDPRIKGHEGVTHEAHVRAEDLAFEGTLVLQRLPRFRD